jgi:hypothetical protein
MLEKKINKEAREKELSACGRIGRTTRKLFHLSCSRRSSGVGLKRLIETGRNKNVVVVVVVANPLFLIVS